MLSGNDGWKVDGMRITSILIMKDRVDKIQPEYKNADSFLKIHMFFNRNIPDYIIGMFKDRTSDAGRESPGFRT